MIRYWRAILATVSRSILAGRPIPPAIRYRRRFDTGKGSDSILARRLPILAGIAILAASILACDLVPAWAPAVSSSSPTDTAAPTPTQAPAVSISIQTETPIPWRDYVKVAAVNVRQNMYGEGFVTVLYSGETVEVVRCIGNRCEIRRPVSGWIWKGCLKEAAGGVGCEATK